MKVDFRVPLSGSQLFDINAYVTARKLCAKFPGLNYEYNDNNVRIFGELTDYWYDQYVKTVFHVGQEE